MTKVKVHSLDQAVSIHATRRLAGSKPDQLLAQLKQQGIGNLEDLVHQVIANAATVSRGSLGALDDDVPMVCYKFTSFRPVFNTVTPEELNQFVGEVRSEIGGSQG
jgi:hypothetical protein